MVLNIGKTALITGASRGLGLALARALAEDGWQLIVDARYADVLDFVQDELRQLTEVVAISGSVVDRNHLQALAGAAKDAGGLDAVVNNAGILGPSPQPDLLDYSLQALEEVYRINTIAPLGVLQAVRDYLKSGVRILNISSDAGVNAYPGWGAMARVKQHWNNSRRYWQRKTLTGRFIGWTQAICERKCTGKLILVRISATGRCRLRASRDC